MTRNTQGWVLLQVLTHPVFIPASHSQSFLRKLRCGQSDIFFFVLFFLIPFSMESNISLVPLGQFEPIFFQEMCLWRFINSILGLSFYQSVPLLHTPNERDSFSHNGKKQKTGLWSQTNLSSNLHSATYWVDEFEWETHSL